MFTIFASIPCKGIIPVDVDTLDTLQDFIQETKRLTGLDNLYIDVNGWLETELLADLGVCPESVIPVCMYEIYKPKTNEELHEAVRNQDSIRCPISKWDVSLITDMNSLFDEVPIDGDMDNLPHPHGIYSNIDISNWDVSNVVDMSCMFICSSFNGDISKWDVSNVVNMNYMFYWSMFDNDISEWDTKSVTSCTDMLPRTRYSYAKPRCCS